MTGRLTFDYIIVGGGTAGYVLASRLSNHIPSKSILVIEAGPESDPRVKPTLGLLVSDASNILWNHRSVPQPELGGKTVGQPQGKILGGSSAVNYQTWTRGAAAEFDLWAEEVGDTRWSWKGMLPYFKRTESFIPGQGMKKHTDSKIHGFGGPITVSHITSSGRPRNYPLRNTIAEINKSIGATQLSDGNAGKTLGYFEIANNIFNGKRQWSSACYNLGSNVTVQCSTQVSRLIITDQKIQGVELITDIGVENTNIYANDEVILCSGVQGSAKILLLSGIGPETELQKHGIASRINLPVGENYSDHVSVHTFWKLNGNGLSLGSEEMVTSDCDWTSGCPCDWLAYFRHDDEHIQMLARDTLEPIAVKRFQLAERPHTESFPLYAHLDLTPDPVRDPGGSVFTMINVLATPFSRGSVRLSSSDPFAPPVIDPGIFSSSIDRELLYACIRNTTLAIIKIATLLYGAKEYGIDEQWRGIVTDESIQARILKTVDTINHGSGTCAMGRVVDTKCKVKGLQGLRVVDASVLPFPMASHYQAVVYALAEQMADVIALLA